MTFLLRTKFIGVVALVTLFFTAVWLALLIWDQAAAGPLETLDQVIAYLANRGWRYTLIYLNAAMVTLCATILMTLLYRYVREIAPDWALVGLVFVPVYCALNLVAYLSQITLVPALVSSIEAGVDDPLVYLLLAQSIQLWPRSAVGFFNGLAYALLGIPSILYGLHIRRGNRFMQAAGWLLVLNGVACISGIIGYLTGNDLLSSGILLGGVLFFLALIPLTLAFLRPVPAPSALVRAKGRGVAGRR
jgi:hypothetical protein